MIRRVVGGTLFSLSALVATAQAQSDYFSPGNTQMATAVTNFNATFGALSGMTIGWTYLDGGHGAGVWTCGTYTCSVTSSGPDGSFSLSANKNDLVFFGLWDLSGTNVTGFTLDAAPASAVFDVTSPAPGTPGSSYGHDYNYCGSLFFGICWDNTTDHWSTSATYSYPVAIIGDNGNQPYGDIWEVLQVSFGKTFNGSAQFEQDDDLVSGLQGDPGSPLAVTPEPATMSLLALGLVGLGVAGRRRRRIV